MTSSNKRKYLEEDILEYKVKKVKNECEKLSAETDLIHIRMKQERELFDARMNQEQELFELNKKLVLTKIQNETSKDPKT